MKTSKGTSNNDKDFSSNLNVRFIFHYKHVIFQREQKNWSR